MKRESQQITTRLCAKCEKMKTVTATDGYTSNLRGHLRNSHQPTAAMMKLSSSKPTVDPAEHVSYFCWCVKEIIQLKQQ